MRALVCCSELLAQAHNLNLQLMQSGCITLTASVYYTCNWLMTISSSISTCCTYWYYCCSRCACQLLLQLCEPLIPASQCPAQLLHISLCCRQCCVTCLHHAPQALLRGRHRL
jgi:hypothetical protein